MNSIKTVQKDIPILKKFLNENSPDTVAKYFTNFINFQNTTHRLPLFSEIIQSTNVLDEKSFLDECTMFLNTIINSLSLTDLNDPKDINALQSIIQIYDIKTQFENLEFENFLDGLCFHFKRKHFSSQLISYDWQISIIDRANDNLNLNKADKVEIVTKFNTFNNSSEEYKSNTVKMGYNDFLEILQNFKKIDGQLHLFKN